MYTLHKIKYLIFYTAADCNTHIHACNTKQLQPHRMRGKRWIFRATLICQLTQS